MMPRKNTKKKSSNRLQAYLGKYLPLKRFEWLIVASIGLLFFTTLLTAHLTRPYGSDDITIQAIFQSWEHGQKLNTIVGADNFILKVPFYLLEDILLPHNSRVKVFISALFFSAVLYVSMIWFFKLYIEKRARSTYLKVLLLFLPLMWYLGLTALPAPQSNFVDTSWVTTFMKINLRNVELGISLLLIAVWAQYLDGKIKINTRGQQSLLVVFLLFTGAFFYNDPYFLFTLGGGITITVATLWLSNRISSTRAGASVAALASIVIVQGALARIMGGFGYVAREHPFMFIGFTKMSEGLLNTGEAIFKMFNADFWGMGIHSPNVKIFLINGILVLYCSIAVIWTSRRLFKRANTMQLLLISTILTTLAAYLFSKYALSYYDARYIILAPFCALPLLASFLLHLASSPKYIRLLTFTILLFAIGIGANVATNLRLLHTSVTHYTDPNAINYEIINAALDAGVTKGYADYFDGPINTYFSDRRVIYIPVTCSGVNTLMKQKWLYNFPDSLIPAQNTFLLTTRENLGEGHGYCGDKKYTASLGRPEKIIHINSLLTMYIYNGDVGRLMPTQ